MRRATLIGAIAAVLVPAALAANGDPQKKLTKADQARARAASLRLGDFPAGWRAERSPSSSSEPRCSNYNPDQSDLVETGDYDSPDFTRADGSFVSSSTGVFRTARMARTAYARVVRPELPDCFAELFRKGTGNPKAVKILGSGTLAFPAYGDRSNAYRLRATYTAQGQTVGLTIDIVVFNQGRVDVATIFLGLGRPLPTAFERSLIDRLAARAH
ncbi:MAG TPA: hypothetical protein VFA66_07505 [Gaiellaceae bacterium]|nr:hypothetical protein [Gaiellaceae bacterium]